MNIIKNGRVLPEPSDELIRREEGFYRVKFPNDYITFLKEYNGGVPVANTFELDGYTYLVERFLCLLGDKKNEYEEGWYDIGVVTTQLFERLTENGDELGITVVPIAALFAGNFVCLDYRGNKDNPTICFWHHELSTEFSPYTKEIASNFSEFLKLLKVSVNEE